MNLDFDRDFEAFVKNDGKSVISEIHTIIPTLTPEQQQVLGTIEYFTSKWDLPDLSEYTENYCRMASKNKNLNFVRSFNFKSLLKAYTMEEYMLGIKGTTQNVNGVDK